MQLQGKTALVTGGGTGIGAAIAQRFVAEGAKVCIAGRRKETLERFATASPPGSVLPCAGNVALYDDVKRMVAAAVEFGGAIDILVNNAASDVYGVITELEPEDWQRVMNVNLNAPFLPRCSRTR
jgi:meso-butanediol dehydrogenase / (S,S)-butanediol dehydrogenase / diacetyl reductase